MVLFKNISSSLKPDLDRLFQDYYCREFLDSLNFGSEIKKRSARIDQLKKDAEDLNCFLVSEQDNEILKLVKSDQDLLDYCYLIIKGRSDLSQ